MKYFISLLLSAVMLCGSAAMPASAAGDPGTDSISPEPLYPFDMPISGQVTVHLLDDVQVGEIRVIQSSPENDALLLYHVEDISASRVDIQLEPGNYEIQISSYALEDQVRYTTASVFLAVENPDFDTTLNQTVCDVFLKTLDADYGEYSIRQSDNSFDDETGIRHIAEEISFFQHTGIFGDMNADQVVNADDANSVLKLYLETLLDPSYTITASEFVHGDYDENGYLTADDSNAILSYYLGKMLSPDFTWDSLKKN